MPYKLWLDDDRPAPKGWVWAKSAQDAIGYLERYKEALADPERIARLAQYSDIFKGLWTITHMSFDHDLADVHYEGFMATQIYPEGHPVRLNFERECAKEMTGYDVLLWMAEHEVWPTDVCYVHTHNSVRGPVMADMINRYGPYEHKTHWTPYEYGRVF